MRRLAGVAQSLPGLKRQVTEYGGRSGQMLTDKFSAKADI